VGIGNFNSPSHPLEMLSGAHVTIGGAWTNSPSREYKENIQDLTTAKALATLQELEPKQFNYKVDPGGNQLGFHRRGRTRLGCYPGPKRTEPDGFRGGADQGGAGPAGNDQSAVFEKIRNHKEFKAVSLGTSEFKNVKEPMEVFALANEGFPNPSQGYRETHRSLLWEDMEFIVREC